MKDQTHPALLHLARVLKIIGKEAPHLLYFKELGPALAVIGASKEVQHLLDVAPAPLTMPEAETLVMRITQEMHVANGRAARAEAALYTANVKLRKIAELSK